MDQEAIYKNLRWVFWVPLAGAVVLVAHLILDLHLLWAHVQRGIMTINSAVTLLLILLAVAFALLTRSRLMKLSQSLVRALNAAERNASDAQSKKSWLEATLTSIGDAVIATDVDGLITLMNPVAEQLTGWAFADAQGKPLADVFCILNEQTRERVENPVDKVRRLKRAVGLGNHTILISKQGHELSIHDSGAPILDADRRLHGAILIFRDVTEQRRAQKAAAQLAAIVEYSGDAIATKGLDGIIQTWNPGAERLFGYRADQIIGKSVSILFPPERFGEEDEIIYRLREGLPSVRLETIRVAKDGRRIPVAEIVSPIKDADGYIVGASKVIHDITELAAKREALTRERELLARTLTSIGDAVIVTDAEGRVTLLNAEAERLTGWKMSDAKDKPLEEVFRIISEHTRQPTESPVGKVLRLGVVVGLANHTLLVSRDGRETPIDDSAAPIRKSDGALFGVVLVFRDFSERRAMEERLRESARAAVAELQDTRRLLEVGARCASLDSTFDECLTTILKAAIVLTKANKGHLQLLDESGSARIAAQSGFDEPFLRFLARVTLDDRTACSEAMRTRERTIVDDVTHSDLFATEPAIKVMREAGVQAVQSTPLRSSNGKILGAISTHFGEPHRPSNRELQMMDLLALHAADYLDRKQAEEELRRSHKRFAELVERAPFGIYGVDSRFRITLMNSGSQSGAFSNAQPVIGRDLAEAMRILWPEPVAEGIIGAFRHTLETGEPFYSPPFTNRRRDKQAVESYEWELHRIMLPDGQYGVICYYFDSTKLREAEAALRERTEELAAMVDWMPALVWVAHDPQCRKVTGNTAASKLLDVSPTANVSQTPGRGAGVLIRHFDSSGRELRPNEQPIQQAAATGVPVENRELQLLLPDGRRVWVAGSATPLFDADGKVRGVISAFLDVTGQKELEGALRANERLALAGRLSASIAHEIHNPLDVVLNVLFLLSQKLNGKPEARRLVDLAQREVRRVTEISRNMLSLHRESRSPSMVKLSELIETAVALIQQTVGNSSKNIELQLEFDGELEAFPAELRQVFTNLIKNAVEAAGTDGRVKVLSETTEQNGRGGVLVQVVDNGIGISDEVRSKLFTPFVSDKEESGTGLGLWVSRNIVERHGGTITIASKSGIPESGTTVSVFLPLKLKDI